MDLAYGEASEAEGTALEVHMVSCAGCRLAVQAYRRISKAAAADLLEPAPADLERRILTRARAKMSPWAALAKNIRALGSAALHPQYAMAAVLSLAAGVSFVVLRGRPPEPTAAPVSLVSEPAPAQEAAATTEPPPERTSPAAPAATALPPALVLDGRNPREQRKAVAEVLDLLAPAEDESAAKSGARATEAARAKADKGCSAAITMFDAAAAAAKSTQERERAKWEAALCSRELGRTTEARGRFAELADSATFGDGARSALAEPESKGGRPSGRGGSAAPARAKASKGAISDEAYGY